MVKPSLSSKVDAEIQRAVALLVQQLQALDTRLVALEARIAALEAAR